MATAWNLPERGRIPIYSENRRGNPVYFFAGSVCAWQAFRSAFFISVFVQSDEFFCAIFYQAKPRTDSQTKKAMESLVK